MAENYVHPNGSGSLFKNSYKEKPNQPDYKGTITLPDGSEKELAGWKGTTQAGDVKLSIKISDKYVKPQSNDAQKSESSEDLF
jgi:uncharacterized protein (DUF736 family)